MPSDIRAIAPTIPASSVMSRMSRFCTCASSWATTPWSSSRESVRRRPSVTARLAVAASLPVAKALGSSSGTIQIFGRGKPEAIAISSTTFTSWRSSAVAGSTNSRAPVDHSTWRGPKRQEYQQIPAAMRVVTIPMTGIMWW